MRLRARMTDAEIVLWNHLRVAMNKWGVVFVPQGIVIGRYIGDFVCYSKKLIIEVDGSIHNTAKAKRKDAYRTRQLNKEGYTVIRFSNSYVLRNCRSVLSRIKSRVGS